MITFFRKIRYNFMNTGKTGKHALPVGRYLKYAIGEIVLVMIGILLALQVNEWNNERNRHKAEAVIVEQLKSDLKKSQVELEEIVERMEESAKASAIVCQEFWKKDVPNDSIYSYMRRPLGTTVYSPILGTARSLINSGNINLLNSAVLKNDITSYVEEVDYKLKDISRYEETYYRGARAFLNDIDFSLLEPKTFFLERLEKSNDSTFLANRNDEYSGMPNVIEKIPFETDLQSLFMNRNIYKAYDMLIVYHKRGSQKYDDILKITNDLLDKLENISK